MERIMKWNLKDYKEEMERLQARADDVRKGMPEEAGKQDLKAHEGSPGIMRAKRLSWPLLSVLMAIIMAILALIGLILSEIFQRQRY
jgi:hypothetical protein